MLNVMLRVNYVTLRRIFRGARGEGAIVSPARITATKVFIVRHVARGSSKGEETFAQTISIFGNAVPNNAVSSKNAVTLGVKFWSSQSGTVSAIRFYRAAANSSGYVANLYTAGGTLLASAMLSRDTCSVPCWEVANFANPISISANTSYVAAYYFSAGAGASDAYGLSNGITNGPLTAPASSVVGGNGVYQHKNAFPSSSFEASNYYVDVLFIPTERSLVLNFNPPNRAFRPAHHWARWSQSSFPVGASSLSS
jgi:hypothetical protein